MGLPAGFPDYDPIALFNARPQVLGALLGDSNHGRLKRRSSGGVVGTLQVLEQFSEGLTSV